MPLVISGATSGQTTIQATDAVTATITLPSTSGTVVVNNGAQTIEFADGSASAPSITNSGDTNTGIFFPAADTIAFTEGGVESMRIDSSANLSVTGGIGATGSISGYSGGELRLGSTTSSVDSAVTSQATGSPAMFFDHRGTSNTGYFRWRNGSGGGTTLMSLDASGNLGLGVTPSAWSSSYKAFQFARAGVLWGASSANDWYLGNNYYYDGTNLRYINNGFASEYYQASGVHAWRTAASGTAGGVVSLTTAMTLNASGGLQTLNTIGVGNATPSTSGAGITFPATQSASTNANTLDDYEEGTWTPVLRTETGGLMTATYTAQYGTYIKVGKQVIARGIMGWSALTRTGLVMLVNLPFLSAGANADAGYIDSSTGISFTSRTGGVGSVMQLSGYTTEYFSYQVSGSGQTFGDPRMDATAFPNVGGVSFTLIYITS